MSYSYRDYDHEDHHETASRIRGVCEVARVAATAGIQG
jgi:hypothetical protein